MPWYFPWSDSIKKRACRYLLQHYLGHFLKEKLTLDQLSVDIYKGTGTINDVLLDVVSINEALDANNVPLEIVDGFVGTISVSIPWSALVSDNTKVEIHNLELTIQPKQRQEKPGVMIDSMFSSFSSMTTSMQLAQECLKQEQSEGEKHAESAQPFEGLEMFAQTIEAVLSQVKVSFIDTIIRLEHLPREASTGAAVEIRISRIEYFDDQATEAGSSVDAPDGRNVYEPAAVAIKNFHIMGLSLYCDEFGASQRTFSRESSSGSHGNLSSSTPPASPNLSDLGISPPLNLTEAATPSCSSETVTKESDPIKVMTCTGRVELKVKLKQNEELAGPKLELNSQIGSLHFHLSPRQVHLILEIVQGIVKPELCDDSNVKSKGLGDKPMLLSDFRKVEHQLQKHLQYSPPQDTWLASDGPEYLASQSLEDESEEVYFDMGGPGEASMESSFSSTATGKSLSSAGSFPSYSVGYTKRGTSPFQATLPRQNSRSQPQKRKGTENIQKLLDDPSAELTKFKLRVSFVSFILLHEDPTDSPGDGIDPGESSTDKLKSQSEMYFSRIPGISTSGMGPDLVNVRKQFSEACPFDHIGILMKPTTAECNQKSSSAINSVTVELSIGLAEIVEAVYDHKNAAPTIRGFSVPLKNTQPDYCELLTFEQEESLGKQPMWSSLHATATPCIRVKIHNYEKQQSSRRSSSHPIKTEINFELAKCKTEVDITLGDRIHALLNPCPLAQKYSGNYGAAPRNSNGGQTASEAAFTQTMQDEGSSSGDTQTDIRVTSTFCTVMLRFPIPDLRQGPGVDKQWWRRLLRKERLLLELTDADFMVTLGMEDICQKFDFTCRDAHALFQDDVGAKPLSFIRVSPSDAAVYEREEGFDWPSLDCTAEGDTSRRKQIRVTVKVFPAQKCNSLLEEALEEDDSLPHDSLNGACQFTKPEPSPFSSKKTMYEQEEMVMPGDKQEMSDFEYNAMNNTRTVLELSLPNVNAILPSKDFFELLYNRIINDVLLWESQAPVPVDTNETYSTIPNPLGGLDLATQLRMQQDGNTMSFSMCKSGVQDDSSSDSEDYSGQFYSIYEQKLRQKKKQLLQDQQKKRQSKMCVNVNITKGRLTFCPPLRDKESKPDSINHGEFMLDLEDGTIFTEVNHNGDPEESLLAVHANKAVFFHNGCVSIPKEQSTIGRAIIAFPVHLHPTVYLSEPGVYTKLHGQVGKGDKSQDMISLAMRIKVDTLRNIKEYTVALGIRGGTLQNRMVLSEQHWFNQLTDFFDVTDYPILGYSLPKILTELHVHIWSCAIDYRPLYLPYRAMVVLETFRISSNILAESPTSLLRFLIEDGALYLSDKRCNHVDLQNNYVCVLDVGTFELSLRTSSGKDPKYPKLDLQLSNNIVHIRTCSDSFRALSELIQYLANDGDYLDTDDTESVHSSSTAYSTEPRFQASESANSIAEDSVSTASNVSQSHLDHVHDMMQDAMRETPSNSPASSKEGTPDRIKVKGTEVFFFPGESPPVDDKHPQQTDSSKTISIEDALASAQLTDSDEYKDRHILADSMQSSTLSFTDSVERGDINVMQHSEHFCDSEEDGGGGAGRQTEEDDDEFCIIDDPGLGIASRSGQPIVRILSDQPISVQDNYFSMPLGVTDQLKAPEKFPVPVYKYTLKEMSLVWYMYGGKDFESSPDSKTSSKATSGWGQKKGPLGKLGWQARGGPGRDVDVLMELQLSKVRLQHEQYPENTEQASRQILLIKEIEIRDRLAASKINKFLYQYTSADRPKQSHANMLMIKALHVRPDPAIPAQECSLKVSIQPLRLYVDQDALFFLKTFFTEISGESEQEDPCGFEASGESDPGPKAAAPAPVMKVAGTTPSTDDNEDLLVMFDEMSEEDRRRNISTEEAAAAKEQPVYFKCFVFSPDVPIRVDYHGKRVTMEHGTLAGLLVGLAHLNCSEIKLKRIHHRHGLLGLERLLMFTAKEWLQDIKKNQLPSILGGVGPMHSFVQLVAGVKDLFWLPVEQYRKDGRIVRGLQRGASSFMTCTAMSALELTNRIVQIVQFAGEVTFDMVTPGPSVRKRHIQKFRRQFNYPADLREGVSNAYNIVAEGIKGTVDNITRTAIEEHEQKGVTGAVGGVLRQVPPTLIQPVILATEATSNILGGMRNQLLPDKKKEDEEKWKQNTD